MANLTDVLNFRSNLTGADIKSLYEAEPNAFVDSDKSKIDSLYYIPTTTITTNYAAADKDEVRCDSSSGTFTITLPASGSVKIVDIVGVDADTGFGVTGLHVTLVPQPGGTTILGETSLDLDVGASRLVFTLYGSDWKLFDIVTPWIEVTDWSDIVNKPTLGTAAATDSTDYATAAQGTLADTAIQPSALSNTALTGIPTAPTAPEGTNTTQIATTAFVLANSSNASLNFSVNTVTYNDGGTSTIDANSGGNVVFSLTSNGSSTTIAMANIPTTGTRYAFELHLTWTSGAITFPASWSDGMNPPSATGNYIITGVTINGGTNYTIGVIYK